MEFTWIEAEPPGLFPLGQDSVWGQARKVFADYLQTSIKDSLTQFYLDLDPATCSEDTLARWEFELGIPVNLSKPVEQRRAFVQSRRQVGPFTRTRRRLIVEAFIIATEGGVPTFDAGGIPFDAGGIIFHSGVFDLTGTYNIVEDIPGFAYDVRVLDTIDADFEGMARELERITTAPITFTITETPTP